MTITKKVAIVGAIATAAIALAGCGDKFQEQFKDAPLNTSGRNDSPVDPIDFPDGYSNVATKCDHGNRLYVLFHGDKPYGSVAVVPNAKDCQS